MPPKKRRTVAPQQVTPASVTEINQELQKVQKEINEMREEITAQLNTQKKLIEEKEKNRSQTGNNLSGENKFTINHTFKDISKMVCYQKINSESYNHSGADWKISLKRSDSGVEFYLSCSFPCEQEWSIDLLYSFDVKGGGLKANTEPRKEVFIHDKTPYIFQLKSDWDKKAARGFDDELSLKCDATILKLTMGPIQTFRSFQKNDIEDADFCLTADGDDFYVIRGILIMKSSFFKGMLSSNNFVESGQNKVTLHDIDPRDLQVFLEVIHGRHTINDENVEGALRVADMYVSTDAVTTCEKYLLHETKLSAIKQFHLSVKYTMKQLTIKSISLMKTKDEIEAIRDVEVDDDIEALRVNRIEQIGFWGHL